MPIITLKKFNDDGIKQFGDFLERTRKNEKSTNIKLPIPPLTSQKNLIMDVDIKCNIDDTKSFHDRYELGNYLNTQLKDHATDYENFGMWAWIAAVYFNQLRGRRTQRSEHFIPDEYKSGGMTSTVSAHYRHSVRMPVYLIKYYEDNWCRFLLKDRINTMGDPMEHCCSNKANLKSPKLRSVILELYQDKKTFLPKPGAFSQVNKTSLASVAGKGGVLRFNGTLRDRLKKSYDIENMNLKTIISKMGPEVNNSKWVK
jgi:hypothetical protein